jgi:glutamine synthetase
LVSAGTNLSLEWVSAANRSNAMTTLNTIVAKQLKDFKKEVDLLIESKDMKKDDAIFNVLREYQAF